MTPREKSWVIQSFLSFDSMDRILKGDHSLESCWAVLIVVLFVFQFYPVCNFGKVVNFGLDTVGIESVNSLSGILLQPFKITLTLHTFPQKFSYFMHIKPPDDNVLQTSLPVVWWDSEDVSHATRANQKNPRQSFADRSSSRRIYWACVRVRHVA